MLCNYQSGNVTHFVLIVFTHEYNLHWSSDGNLNKSYRKIGATAHMCNLKLIQVDTKSLAGSW